MLKNKWSSIILQTLDLLCTTLLLSECVYFFTDWNFSQNKHEHWEKEETKYVKLFLHPFITLMLFSVFTMWVSRFMEDFFYCSAFSAGSRLHTWSRSRAASADRADLSEQSAALLAGAGLLPHAVNKARRKSRRPTCSEGATDCQLVVKNHKPSGKCVNISHVYFKYNICNVIKLIHVALIFCMLKIIIWIHAVYFVCLWFIF